MEYALTFQKLNERFYLHLGQILFLLLVVAARATDITPQIAITALGAFVFVTTVVSGLDYVITYSRRAVEVSRRRRGLA